AFAVIDRGRAESLLRDLLQAALEVRVAHRRWQGPVAVEVVVVRGVVAGVQENSPQHSLELVGEQRLEAAPTTLGDALAEVEVASKIELLRELRERVRVHHRGARLRQLTLGGARVVLVEILGGDQLEDRVTEVLQALVVARRDRWVLIGE